MAKSTLKKVVIVLGTLISTNAFALNDEQSISTQVASELLSGSVNEGWNLNAMIESRNNSSDSTISTENNTTSKLRKKLASKETEISSLTKENALLSEKIDLMETRLQQSSEALKKADETILKARQSHSPDLNDSKNFNSWIAGKILSESVKERLSSWKAVGIDISPDVLLTGLADGVRDLSRVDNAKMKNGLQEFSRFVEVGVQRQVELADQQHKKLAKGLKHLKDIAGISFYQIKEGSRVEPENNIYQLSMTESVAEGKIISKTPVISLNADDKNLPLIVREGASLVGKGGEIVAFAMAKVIYGTQPIPHGIHPFTLMEYHIKGH